MTEWAQELGREVSNEPLSDQRAACHLPLVANLGEIVELIRVDGSGGLRALYTSGARAEEFQELQMVGEEMLRLKGGRMVPVDRQTADLVRGGWTGAGVAELEELTHLAAQQTGLLARFQGCTRVALPSLFRHAFAVH